jgi:hypothetical protein
VNDLIATLQHIEKRPGMYFGDAERSRSIHILQAFIVGFQSAQNSADALDCFTEWVATHYDVVADTKPSFEMILEHVGRDDRKAYEEFFRLLPVYLRERERVGTVAIRLRFSEAQDRLLKVFGKVTTQN